MYLAPENRNAWKMDTMKILHFVKHKPWLFSNIHELNNLVRFINLFTLKGVVSLHQFWWKKYQNLPTNLKINSLSEFADIIVK